MKYNDLTLGQIEAIVNKLGGMDGVKNFLSGKGDVVDNSFLDPMTLDPTMLKFEVEVDISLTNREALEVTRRILYINDKVLSEAPRTTKTKQTIYLFKKDSDTSCSQREEEFNKRNLKEADLLTISAFNKAHPEFADNKPNSIQWKDSAGNYCCAIFGRGWHGRRCVGVLQDVSVWFDRWWFVGVCKSEL